jgi:hypothetical protein
MEFPRTPSGHDAMELPRTPSGHDAILVIVDRLSKIVHFCPTTSDVDAIGSAKLFFNHWYRHYGLPRKFLSDRDSRFVGKCWQELFRLTQVRLAMSSSHHPQTDGQTERTNRTMEEMLRHYVNYWQNNSDEVLPALEHAYNNSINATTRQVPFELLYGQKPLEFKDLLLQSPTTTVESVNAFVSRMESLVVDASNLSHKQTGVLKVRQIGNASIMFLEWEIRCCCLLSISLRQRIKVERGNWPVSSQDRMKSFKLCRRLQ